MCTSKSNDDEKKVARQTSLDRLVGVTFIMIYKAEICISLPTTVVTICNKLNVENITYTLDLRILFP